MMGTDNINERVIVRQKIDDILVKNRKTWNDLIELMAVGPAARRGAEEAGYTMMPFMTMSTPLSKRQTMRSKLVCRSNLFKPPNVLDLTRYILKNMSN